MQNPSNEPPLARKQNQQINAYCYVRFGTAAQGTGSDELRQTKAMINAVARLGLSLGAGWSDTGILEYKAFNPLAFSGANLRGHKGQTLTRMA